MVLRWDSERFHSRITWKFSVPSPNGAPAFQPLTFSRLAVEASTSRTLCRKSHWRSQGEHARRAVAQSEVAVAVILDAVLDVGRRQKLRLPDLAGIGTDRVAQQQV